MRSCRGGNQLRHRRGRRQLSSARRFALLSKRAVIRAAGIARFRAEGPLFSTGLR